MWQVWLLTESGWGRAGKFDYPQARAITERAKSDGYLDSYMVFSDIERR